MSKKNPWNIINLILSGISLIIGAIASLKDNETMKQEIIEEVTNKITNKEA